jgi:hypothetical protein
MKALLLWPFIETCILSLVAYLFVPTNDLVLYATIGVAIFD